MPPMKIEEFRSWIKKRYGGVVRLLTDGTDKASEEGHTYFRQFLFVVVINNKKIYYSSTMPVKGKLNKQYLHDSRFIIELHNDEWYLKNHEAVKKYVDFFVAKVIEEILK